MEPQFIFTFADVIGLLQFSVIIAGVAVGCWQIGAQRKLAKQNNSINKMWEMQKDDNLRESMESVAKMREKGEKVESYASLKKLKENTGKSEWDEDSRKKSHALDAVVEYFELVSIGVGENIYDEKIVRIYARNIFVEMYARTEPFIVEMRNEHDKFYGKEFQKIAEKFRKSG